MKKTILLALAVAVAQIGSAMAKDANIEQLIDQSDRFVKALPPALVARIEATQAKIDPTCSTQFNVTDIPASFSVIYKKAERDSAGMLTASCTYRPETEEIFYAGIHYPDPRRN